jgi:NAD/NADP transhydrogenase alpha subunit
MQVSEAFAAIALGAVASDGALGRDEAHHLRNQLEHRTPFATLSDQAIGDLFDGLLGTLRERGAKELVGEAIPALSPPQRETALAIAAHLVHSDRVVTGEEEAFLHHLAAELALPDGRAEQILDGIAVWHRDSLAS